MNCSAEVSDRGTCAGGIAPLPGSDAYPPAPRPPAATPGETRAPAGGRWEWNLEEASVTARRLKREGSALPIDRLEAWPACCFRSLGPIGMRCNMTRAARQVNHAHDR
jgi:hypothetical protein